MKRSLLALFCLVVGVTAAQAHFVFIVPDATGAGAKVVFSDSLSPDENVPIAKIANLKLFLRDASGNNHDGKIVGAMWVRADGSAIPPTW